MDNLKEAEARQQEAMLQKAKDILATRNLVDFVRAAWPIVEPGTTYIHNWHIDLICAELEAVTRGETKELVICIPPRHLKSRLVCVFWQAWWWLHDPSVSIISITNEESLAADQSVEMRHIITSEWYKGLVESQASEGKYSHLDTKIWTLTKDQNQKVNFKNSVAGGRRCLGVNSAILGKGADGLIVDDPLAAKDVQNLSSAQVLKRVEAISNKYDNTWRSRLNNQETGWRVIIMQRLHVKDLAGYRIGEGARAIVLPTEYDPDLPEKFGGAYPLDPRTEPGELLFPERFSQCED
jgi:hypothetical protein